MTYVCTCEEGVYGRKLDEFIASLIIRNVHPMMREKDAPASPSVDLVVLQWPFHDSICGSATFISTSRRTFILNYVRGWGLMALGF